MDSFIRSVASVVGILLYCTWKSLLLHPENFFQDAVFCRHTRTRMIESVYNSMYLGIDLKISLTSTVLLYIN